MQHRVHRPLVLSSNLKVAHSVYLFTPQLLLVLNNNKLDLVTKFLLWFKVTQLLCSAETEKASYEALKHIER